MDNQPDLDVVTATAFFNSVEITHCWITSDIPGTVASIDLQTGEHDGSLPGGLLLECPCETTPPRLMPVFAWTIGHRQWSALSSRARCDGRLFSALSLAGDRISRATRSALSLMVRKVQATEWFRASLMQRFRQTACRFRMISRS